MQKRFHTYRRIYILLSIILVLSLVFTGLVATNVENSANAILAENIDTQSTNLGEMLLDGYEDKPMGNVFDGEVFWELISQISGVAHPNLETINTLTSVKTSENFRESNSGKDIVVTIGGKQWIATYLSSNKSGEPILTLWQANYTSTDIWNPEMTTDQTTVIKYPINMYGISYVRSVALNNGGGYTATYKATSLTPHSQSSDSEWAIYTMDNVAGSLTEFIEVPDNMAWQHDQKTPDYIHFIAFSDTLNNEALDYGASVGCDYSTDSRVAHTYYSVWANDRLWLPSVTELGVSGLEGLWGLTDSSRQERAYYWTRSSHGNNAYYVYGLYITLGSAHVIRDYGVRPAFHLNLKAVAERAGKLSFDSPTDVECVYQGHTLTLSDISSEQTKWYDSTYMTLTYPTSGIKDAGVYQVTVKLNDYAISGGMSFYGDPDEEKGEDEYTRIINFTVTKKEISLNLVLDTSGMPVVSLKNSLDIYSGDTPSNNRAPTLGLRYVGINGTDSTSPPTAVGEYTATAYIVNASCNYVLDTTYSIEFSIKKTNIPKPVISGQSSKQYAGVDVDFSMTGGNNSAIAIELPEGMTRYGDTLTARKAGTYTVICRLADGGESTQWADGTTTAVELTYEITKKPLTIIINCDDTDFIWNAGDRPTVTIVGDSFESDSTELYIYYIDNNVGPTVKYDNINNDKVIDGKTRTIVMPGDIPQGSYTIYVELYGSSKDNDNYSLTTCAQTFTVIGKDVTMNAQVINWICNTTAIGNPESTYVLTYTGMTYRFSIDDSVLFSHGVRLDISKAPNGYSGDTTAIDAKSGLYSVTVYIVNYDNTYDTYNGQFTLYYQIDKAKYDLSVLSWPRVNTLAYTGSAQSMELVGTLPAGLQADYAGNKNVPVGSYSTTVIFTVSANYVGNYYVPTAGAPDSYTGDFNFTYDWKIVRATIDASWSSAVNDDSDVFKLPTLKSVGSLDLDSMVEYTYRDSDGSEITSLPAQIVREMTITATATLKPTFAERYQFSNGTSTTDAHVFVIGANKYVVMLALKYDGLNIDGALLPYKGSAYIPTVEITQGDGGVVPADITLTFYRNDELVDKPLEVGKYRVSATLNYGGDLNYIDSDSAEFEFEIIKADFDVSALVWKYNHGGVSAEYDFAQAKWLDGEGHEILPITYDGSAHTLTLAGSNDIAGLKIVPSGIEQTDAGEYTANLVFIYDENCYNAPDFPTSLSWSVAKAVIDTDGIVWGYTTLGSGDEYAYTGNLEYTRLDNGAVHYVVGLINVPDILKPIITYAGDEREQNKVGEYVTEYVLGDLGSNYEAVVMPVGMPSKLTWSIAKRMIDKPAYDNSWAVFDGEVHDFIEAFGITLEGWNNYISVTISKDGAPYAGIDGNPYSAFDAGVYTIKFDLILYDEEMPNIDWVAWPDYEYNIRIKAYEINVNEWQGSNTSAEVNLESWVKKYVGYRYLDADGKTVTIYSMLPDVVYTKELYALDGYDNDISIFGNFRIPVTRPGAVIALEKPVFDENKVVTYDGTLHTVEEFLLKSADSGVEFKVDGDLINAGEYVVTISLASDMFEWEDGSKDSYTVTLTIAKIAISQNTLVWSVDDDGMPTLSARGHGDLEFVYTYYDVDGFELSLDEIADGMQFVKVTARLKDNNYQIVDAEQHAVSEIVYDPSAQGDDGVDPTPDDSGSSIDFAKVEAILEDWWQIIASAVAIVLIIAFTAKGMSYASKRRAVRKTIKNKYADVYAGVAGLFGLATKYWTVIACTLMGVALLSFIFMLMEKRRYAKALDALDEAKSDHDQAVAQKKDNDMKMMLMGIVGANGGAQTNAMDMGAIHDMIEDAVGRNAQQYLPPQTSADDDTIQRLSDAIAGLQEQIKEDKKASKNNANDELVESINASIERMQQQIAEERTTADDGTIERLNDTIANLQEQLNDNRSTANDELMEKLAEQSAQYEENIRQLTEQNEENLRRLAEQNEKTVERLMQQFQPKVGDESETIRRLKDTIARLQEQLNEERRATSVPSAYDETIQRLNDTITRMQERINAPVAMPAYDETIQRLNDTITRMQERINAPVAMPAYDETIQRLNDTITRMQEQLKEERRTSGIANDDALKSILEGQRLIMQKLVEQPREFVSAPSRDDDTIKQIMRNQELLMEKILTLVVNQNAQPQIVEKKVEVPVEKVVEVPVEKIVEKVVEKPVVKEVPIHAPADKSTKADKKSAPLAEKAPRLTIDEAYALLSKEQKKFFDKLREYALSKEKCKEKKQTYSIVLGQSTVNPLIKLTVKKDTTVALFKMEDEYLKDIRRSAGSDGTKVKVKETEVIVADQLAFDTAKQMIDLREDQIDRYEEYLKEQKLYKK